MSSPNNQAEGKPSKTPSASGRLKHFGKGRPPSPKNLNDVVDMVNALLNPTVGVGTSSHATVSHRGVHYQVGIPQVTVKKHPFQIYFKSYDKDTDTLKFGVWTGKVGGRLRVPGTFSAINDGLEIVLPPYDGEGDDTPYYVWLTYCPTSDSVATWGLAYGKVTDDHAVSIEGDGAGETFQTEFEDPWEAFGTDDVYHLVIGTIDNTAGGGKYTIEQRVFQNLPVESYVYGGSSSGACLPEFNDPDFYPIDADFAPRWKMRFRSTYRATAMYYLGDVVTWSDTHFNYQFVCCPDTTTIVDGPTIAKIPDPLMADLHTRPWYLLAKSPKAPAFYNDDGLLKEAP